MSKSGLSKTTNLQGDLAKKGAVKTSSAPFTNKIASNSRPLAKHPGALYASGKGSAGTKFTDGSTAKGWKK